MIRVLREERGREKVLANNASHRRADVSKAARPFAAASESLSTAEQHRNKLLSYQATSAKRTQIIDEAADFETPSVGQSMWASPQQRALQLKQQQKILREQEWNARPEYEKRRAVVSIDLVGGKVVKKMGVVERPAPRDEPEPEPGRESEEADQDTGLERGSLGRNPLLGSLIRPVYPVKQENAGHGDVSGTRHQMWRRVQDDNDDNEGVILDGGVYGRHNEEQT